jgi:hypothetical protein
LAENDNTSYLSLYDTSILQKMLSVLIMASIVGAIINVIPYFFYDLTELKQQGMVKVLKIRAFFEDFGNNALSDSDLVEVIEMVETANELVNQDEAELSKDGIKSARKTKDKQAIKNAKLEYKKAEARNLEIKLAPYVVNEMHRFERALGEAQVADATRVFNAGLTGLAYEELSALKAELSEAKALAKSTEEEKEIRKYKINFCRTRITAKKYYNKYYSDPSEFVEPDSTTLNELFNKEEHLDAEEDKLYKELFEAKESKDKQRVKNLNAQIKELKVEFTKLNKEINEEQNKQLSYTRSAKPMLDAKKLLRQAENYTHFDEIKERYEEAKKNLEALDA